MATVRFQEGDGSGALDIYRRHGFAQTFCQDQIDV